MEPGERVVAVWDTAAMLSSGVAGPDGEAGVEAGVGKSKRSLGISGTPEAPLPVGYRQSARLGSTGRRAGGGRSGSRPRNRFVTKERKNRWACSEVARPISTGTGFLALGSLEDGSCRKKRAKYGCR